LLPLPGLRPVVGRRRQALPGEFVRPALMRRRPSHSIEDTMRRLSAAYAGFNEGLTPRKTFLLPRSFIEGDVSHGSIRSGVNNFLNQP
jgi:hypothetical protein